MVPHFVGRQLICAAAILLIASLTASSALAQKPKPVPKPDKAELKRQALAKAETERYVVPADANVSKLLTFINGLESYKPKDKDAAKLAEHEQKADVAILAAANKIIQLESDTKAVPRRRAERYVLLDRVKRLDKQSEADQKKTLDDVKAAFAEDKLFPADATIAQSVGTFLTKSAKPEVAAEAYRTMAKAMIKSKDHQLMKTAKKLQGYGHRLSLKGQPFTLSGKTVEGKKLDWASYRGKYVIILFFSAAKSDSTNDLNSLKEPYKQFHPKGLDVVAVSLDTNRKELKPLLDREKYEWATLIDELKGAEAPLAVDNGIDTLPTSIVVDKEGKVLFPTPTKEELSKWITDQFNPAEGSPPADAAPVAPMPPPALGPPAGS